MNRLLIALTLLALAAPVSAHPLDESPAATDYEWYLRKKLEKLRASEDALKAQVAGLEQSLAATQHAGSSAKQTFEKEAEKLEREKRELKSQLSTLGSSAEDLKRQLEELRRAHEQSEKRAQQFREMVARFQSMVDAGKLQVEIRNGLMLVKLPDNILFDPGKTDLKPAGKDAIEQVTHILSGIEGRKFQVTGHTDNVPIRSKRFRSNWELSSARAVVVVQMMIAAGMDPARLSAAGYAEQLPVASNADALGRLQNRRIEIVVQPNLEDLPQLDAAPVK